LEWIGGLEWRTVYHRFRLWKSKPIVQQQFSLWAKLMVVTRHSGIPTGMTAAMSVDGGQLGALSAVAPDFQARLAV